MPKGGIFKVKRRKEARKEEDLSLHTPAPENKTNLCSYAKIIIKIGSKLKKKNGCPKALAISKTAAPFLVLQESLSFVMSA